VDSRYYITVLSSNSYRHPSNLVFLIDPAVAQSFAIRKLSSGAIEFSVSGSLTLQARPSTEEDENDWAGRWTTPPPNAKGGRS